MTYDEFKKMADSILEVNSIKPNTYHKGKIIASEEDAPYIKILLALSICFGAIVNDYCFHFSELLLATGDASKSERYGIKETFCKDGVVRSMANKLSKLCTEYVRNMNVFGAGEEESLKMCDCIDKAEELLEPITSAYKRMLLWKLTRKTLSTPYDPFLLEHMVMSFVLLSIAKMVWQNLEYNFKDIADKHKFLKMQAIFDQMNKIWSKVEFHDDKMRVLTLNINTLVSCKEAREIADDIIAMVFSYDFHRELMKISCPEQKIEPRHHLSFLPSLDKITLTIEEFAQKYNSKYRNAI